MWESSVNEGEGACKEYLLTIQMWMFVVGDKELAAIGIGPTVCH